MTSLKRFDEEEPFKESFEIFNECKNFKNSIFDPKNDVRILDLIHFYENIICKYLNSSNNILKEYSNYINERYKTMLDGQGKNSPCDITKYFIGYPSVWEDSKNERTIELSFEFFGSLFSRIEKKQNTNCEFWQCQYNYYFLKYFPNDSKNQNLPIIEIRSRDFLYDENKNIVRIEVHLVTYTEWFDNLYKNNKEEYVNLKGKQTKFLKEKYNNSKIFDLFYYEASAEKNNQRQLGKIIYENESKISYLELIEILNKILEVQKFIDDELSKL